MGPIFSFAMLYHIPVATYPTEFCGLSRQACRAALLGPDALRVGPAAPPPIPRRVRIRVVRNRVGAPTLPHYTSIIYTGLQSLFTNCFSSQISHYAEGS